MERTGEVTAVLGDKIEITFCRPAECEHCHACIGGESQRRMIVQGEASVGDQAVVEMPAADVAKASAIAYLLPLAMLLCGMFAGALLFPAARDAAAAIGAVIGLALSLIVLKTTEKKRSGDPKWQPQLVRVIARKGTEDGN